MLSSLPGHRFVFAKQIKQALTLPGKETETKDCYSHKPVVQECLLQLKDTVLMKTQSIRCSNFKIPMFNIIQQRDSPEAHVK